MPPIIACFSEFCFQRLGMKRFVKFSWVTVNPQRILIYIFILWPNLNCKKGVKRYFEEHFSLQIRMHIRSSVRSPWKEKGVPKYLKAASCACVSAWFMNDGGMMWLNTHTLVQPCPKWVISHFDYFLSESNAKWHSNFTAFKKKMEANQPLHNLILSTWRHFNNSKHEPFMK